METPQSDFIGEVFKYALAELGCQGILASGGLLSVKYVTQDTIAIAALVVFSGILIRKHYHRKYERAKQRYRVRKAVHAHFRTKGKKGVRL